MYQRRKTETVRLEIIPEVALLQREKIYPDLYFWSTDKIENPRISIIQKRLRCISLNVNKTVAGTFRNVSKKRNVLSTNDRKLFCPFDANVLFPTDVANKIRRRPKTTDGRVGFFSGGERIHDRPIFDIAPRRAVNGFGREPECL